MSDVRAIRVWDLPTRSFHWLLAAGVAVSVVSARLGGSAMRWHFASGYLVFALLAFRLLWGFVGGRWSRFAAFVRGPSTSLRYLRGASRPDELHDVGHSPLGAWSVLALLGSLVVQVATGLVADDEIAERGPLAGYVGAAFSESASHWHRDYGQWLVVALALLHVGAIALHRLRSRRDLIGAMLHGDKTLPGDVPASLDTAATRLLALALAALCVIGVALVARLGD